MGTSPGDGILGPLAEEVEVRAFVLELATMEGVGVEVAGADLVVVAEEGEFAPAEAVVVGSFRDEPGHGR